MSNCEACLVIRQVFSKLSLVNLISKDIRLVLSIFTASSNSCTHVEEFQCHTGECIPKEWVRDGGPEADCTDGSDEIGEGQQAHQYGAQLLSGRVLVSRPKGRQFEPQRRHCLVVLEQDTFILA